MLCIKYRLDTYQGRSVQLSQGELTRTLHQDRHLEYRCKTNVHRLLRIPVLCNTYGLAYQETWKSALDDKIGECSAVIQYQIHGERWVASLGVMLHWSVDFLL